MLLQVWDITVTAILVANSVDASDYVEVPTFLRTTSNDSPQRRERSYNAQLQALLEALPGVPGIDYPVYSTPLTGFSCYGKFYGGE